MRVAALARREAVRRAFLHAWRGYALHAFGADVLRPLSRTGAQHLVKMGETIVDALDGLLLMGDRGEYERARAWVAARLRFGGRGQADINLFETTIRVLGGLLGAFDLSGEWSCAGRRRRVVERTITRGLTRGGPATLVTPHARIAHFRVIAALTGVVRRR